MDIKIFLMGQWAFVDCKTGFLLCIGTKADVDNATPTRIGEMVLEASAVSKYQGIESGKFFVLN